MKEEKILNILKFYYETNKLKEVERTGWKIWNASKDARIESIAEHIYGTQQLAIAIFSEFELNIDIYKVITMLSLHETEEINIGDITPYDGISREKKRKMGKKAVEKTFANLSKKDMFKALIDEFDERSTAEGKFAHLCDKLECDLQAKKYSDYGRFSFENVAQNIMEHERVKKAMTNGAKTVADIFIECDTQIYEEDEIFMDMISFLKNYSVKQIT